VLLADAGEEDVVGRSDVPAAPGMLDVPLHPVSATQNPMSRL
jgi:hypothetical protein